MFNSLFMRSCGLVLGLGLSVVAVAGPASNSGNLFNLNQATSQFARLTAAYQGVQADRAVRAVIGKSGLHAILISQKIESAEVQTTKFQHYYQGIEVLGSQVFFHESKGGSETEVRSLLADFDLSAVPALTPYMAYSIASSEAGIDGELANLPELKVLPSQDGPSARLIYSVRIKSGQIEGGREILVDANSGELLADIPDHLEIAPIEVYSAADPAKTTLVSLPSQLAKLKPVAADQPDFLLPTGGTPADDVNPADWCQVVDAAKGRPLAITASKCDKVIFGGKALATADAAAKRANGNVTKVLSYYLNTHQRNSFDGRGGKATSVVHVGKAFNNAFWSTDMNLMGYGDGDGKTYADFTRGVDVAGHEMTHGVVSQTAKLMGMGESGALNEAYADFFGIMISGSQDWILGKALYLKPGPSSAIRNLANPAALKFDLNRGKGTANMKPYPRLLKEKFVAKGACSKDANDNCFVHINSTIMGHAGYLVTAAIGRPQAEKLWYLVMTQFLSSTSTLAQAGSATAKACPKLFDAPTCEKVTATLATLGL